MPFPPQTATKVATSSIAVAAVTAVAGLGLLGMAAGLLPGISAGKADLSVSVSASAQSVSAVGDELTYSIVVKNAGTAASGDFSLTDKIDVDVLTLVSGTSSTATCSYAASTVACPIKSLAAGASATMSVRTKLAKNTVACGKTGTVVSSVTADPGGKVSDSNTKNNVGTSRTTISGAACQAAMLPNLTVTDLAIASTNGLVTATLKNTGTADVTTAFSIFMYVNGTKSMTYSTSTLADASSMNAGGYSSLSTKTVDLATTTSVKICTDALEAIAESDETDNCVEWTAAVAAGIDLTVTKTGSVPTAKQAELVAYTIAVTNGGTIAATSVGVTDVFTEPFTFSSATGTNGFACTLSSKTVVCKGATIAAGKTATIIVKGAIGATGLVCDTTKTISDVATVDPLNKIVETNEGNNKATAETILTNPCSGSSTTTTTTTTTGITPVETTTGSSSTQTTTGDSSTSATQTSTPTIDTGAGTQQDHNASVYTAPPTIIK